MICDCCGFTSELPEVVARSVFEPEYGSTVCGECVSALISVPGQPTTDDDNTSQGGQT